MSKIIDFSKFSPLAQHLLQLEIEIRFTGRSEYYLGRGNGKKQALKEIEELRKQLKGASIKAIIIDEFEKSWFSHNSHIIL